MAKKDIDKEIEQVEKEIVELNEPKKSDNEKVILELPISEAEQDDWWCCLNGRSYLIQRGKKVLVPKGVKEIYDNEQRQKLESYNRSKALQNAAAAKSDRLAFD